MTRKRRPDSRPKALTKKQQKFVEAYMATGGNKLTAARTAGYAGDDRHLRTQATKLLKQQHIQAAIAERTTGDALIAQREDRQRFWTKVMKGDPFHQNDPHTGKRVERPAKMSERLKASELLGKSQLDFIEQVTVKGDVAHVHTYLLPDNGRSPQQLDD